MRMLANVPPRLAINKLRQCTEEKVKEQWWAAKSTRLDIQAIMLAHMSNGSNATTIAQTILEFMNDGKPGQLTDAQQKLLKEKNPLFVIYQFDKVFMQEVFKQYKLNLLKPDLERWTENFSANVSQLNNSNLAKDFLQAHDSFMDCYQYGRCKNLFSQPALATAITKLDAIVFTQPANETIAAAVPAFFKNGQQYLDRAYVASQGLNSSFVLLAASYVMDNPVAYEVGAITLLSLFLFRKKLAKINPFQYFSHKPAQNDPATAEELRSLTNSV
jgi:hypothetical protein